MADTSTKITTARDDLNRAMAALGRIVERKNTIPILGHVRLVAADGGLTLTTTDLDIHATANLPQVENAGLDGSVTVPASTFGDILRKIAPGADVTLEWDADASKVALRSGRSRFSLNALPAADFPDIAEGTMSHSFRLPASTLAALIYRTSFAMSSEETRYYLNGIYLHAGDNADGPALIAVATDGHRLAKLEVHLPEGAAGMPGIIIPRKTVAEIARLIKDSEGDIAVDVSAAKIRIAAGQYRLVSKLIDGTFPDYTRVIPREGSTLVTVDREALAATVQRVATISAERGRAVKLSFSDASSGTITASVNNPDAGSAEDQMAAEITGPALETGYNAAYLGEILGTLEGETITIELTQAGAPALIHTPGETAHRIVLMPMRI